MGSEATGDTRERRLSTTIMLINVTAGRTGARRIMRINKDHGNTCSFRLIDYFHLKIVKCPAIQRRSLPTLNRYPVTYPTQILKCDGAICALRGLYELLGYAVINIFAETRLPTCHVFQAAFGGLRAFLLKFASQVAVAVTNVLNCLARVEIAVTVYRDILNTQINTQNAFNVNRFAFFHIAHRKQVERPFDVDQIGFTLLGLEQFQLTFSRCKRNRQPTSNRPDGDLLVRQSPIQHSIIISDAAMWLKDAPFTLIQLVSIGHFRDTADHDLSGEIKLSAGFVVGQLMQFELRKGFAIPCPLADVVTSSISSFQRLEQVIVLFSRWVKFHFCSQFHALYRSILVPNSQDIERLQMVNEKEQRIPLPAKAGSILRWFL